MIDTAIILAGGKGSRLAPWPAPKSLLPINGTPIIERLIAHIEPHVKRVIVCTGYRASDVEAALKNRANILFSNAGEDAPMGARLIQAKNDYSVSGQSLVLYGDELADVDMMKLLALHESEKSALTFVGYKQHLPFGVVHGDGNIYAKEVVVNVGFAVVEPECWTKFQAKDGLAECINRVDNKICYIHEGLRSTVNSFLDLDFAEKVWK